jgi:hypothetical protein
MPKDLLARARVEAERARAPIRAAALMRIARVQTTFDRGQARITFEMGLAEAWGFRGREGRALLSRIQGEPMLSPDEARIRCPKCEWKPNVESRWGCKCRHCLEHFFDRRIVSRVRGYQWTVTSCHSCGERSPHADWYVRNEGPSDPDLQDTGL